MPEYTDILLLFILGAVGSFISGLLGVGGGIVYVPILDYFLYKLGLRNDELVKGILANSLFTIIFSGIISSRKQYKLNNFFPNEILMTALPGVVSVLLMTVLINTGNWYSKDLFNIVFASLVLLILLRMFYASGKVTPEATPVKTIQYQVTGFFTGIVTALSGLGGGVLMTPLITEWMKQPIKKASSISNGVIPILAIAVGLFNLSLVSPPKVSEWQYGYIVFPIVVPMIFASFIFAPLGVRTSHKGNQQTIRFIFASFLSIILIKLMYEIFT